VLAYLSKVLVEDRGMSWARLKRSTPLTFASMVAGVAVVAVAATALNWSYDQHVAQAERQAVAATKAAAAQPCHGAAAMVDGARCANPFGPAEIVTMGPANQYYNTPPECVQLDKYRAGDTKTTSVCDFSEGARSPKTVWLVGDSHAQQWQGPLLELARENKWVFKLSLLGGCPFAKIAFTGYRTVAAPAGRQRCTDWTAHMTNVIAADKPAMVFMSFYAREEFADDGSGRSQTEQYRDGLEAYWRTLTGAGARVFVMVDPPLNGEVRAQECVQLNPADPLACAVDRATAQPPDPLTKAARSTRVRGVSHIDLTNYFCDERRCYSVVGNVVVYFDADHLNLEFSRSMKPMIAEAIGLR